jgi:hypothetical protein
MPWFQGSLDRKAPEHLPGVHLLEAFPRGARCRFPSRLSSTRLQRAHSGQASTRTYNKCRELRVPTPPFEQRPVAFLGSSLPSPPSRYMGIIPVGLHRSRTGSNVLRSLGTAVALKTFGR